jgi:hypothetical protein
MHFKHFGMLTIWIFFQEYILNNAYSPKLYSHKIVCGDLSWASMIVKTKQTFENSYHNSKQPS